MPVKENTEIQRNPAVPKNDRCTYIADHYGHIYRWRVPLRPL